MGRDEIDDEGGDADGRRRGLHAPSVLIGFGLAVVLYWLGTAWAQARLERARAEMKAKEAALARGIREVEAREEARAQERDAALTRVEAEARRAAFEGALDHAGPVDRMVMLDEGSAAAGGGPESERYARLLESLVPFYPLDGDESLAGSIYFTVRDLRGHSIDVSCESLLVGLGRIRPGKTRAALVLKAYRELRTVGHASHEDAIRTIEQSTEAQAAAARAEAAKAQEAARREAAAKAQADRDRQARRRDAAAAERERERAAEREAKAQAILKQAGNLARIKQARQAREFLRQVVNEFGETDAAREARELLGSPPPER